MAVNRKSSSVITTTPQECEWSTSPIGASPRTNLTKCRSRLTDYPIDSLANSCLLPLSARKRPTEHVTPGSIKPPAGLVRTNESLSSSLQRGTTCSTNESLSLCCRYGFPTGWLKWLENLVSCKYKPERKEMEFTIVNTCAGFLCIIIIVPYLDLLRFLFLKTVGKITNISIRKKDSYRMLFSHSK